MKFNQRLTPLSSPSTHTLHIMTTLYSTPYYDALVVAAGLAGGGAGVSEAGSAGWLNAWRV